MKAKYDRHRRIRKRITVGGLIMGEELPEIRKTWGQVFIAKRKGKEMADYFASVLARDSHAPLNGNRG